MVSIFFFFKQKTAYEMRISDWSSDVCSSDLVGALRSTAEKVTEGEHAGLYRIKGQKIFITFGEHDLTDNIVHLVLARTPGAPEGTRGISLFLVPKYRLDADGKPAQSNGVHCASIEHKLGIHGSPTAGMVYGEDEDCLGEIEIGRASCRERGGQSG